MLDIQALESELKYSWGPPLYRNHTLRRHRYALLSSNTPPLSCEKLSQLLILVRSPGCNLPAIHRRKTPKQRCLLDCFADQHRSHIYALSLGCNTDATEDSADTRDPGRYSLQIRSKHTDFWAGDATGERLEDTRMSQTDGGDIDKERTSGERSSRVAEVGA